MKAPLAALLFLFPVFCFAQNLVPNPSFESVACPDDWMEPFGFGAEHWYNPTGSTPDYMGFETVAGCHVSIFNDGWSDTGEWQYPQDGEFLVGLVSYIHSTCVREYVSCRLIEPLQAGVVYVASMHVSLSNTCTGSTDGLGMYFSTDSLSDYNSYCDFNVIGQMQNDAGNHIVDTTNWILIEGEFMAQGGEEFLLVGNILSNENGEFESVYEDSLEFFHSYYFIDNVLVEEKSSVGIEGEIKSETKVVYPNPATDVVILPPFESNAVLVIRDNQGRICQKLESFGRRLDISFLEKGNYFVEIRVEEVVEVYRIVVE